MLPHAPPHAASPFPEPLLCRALLPPFSHLPEQLFVIGRPPPDFVVTDRAFSTRFNRSVKVCIIGSRRYSPYGERACRSLVEALAPYDVWIISGLALGIDSIAHDAAIRHSLPTAAVIGSGLAPEALYPASHIHLAKDIINAGGALISQFAYDMPAAPWTFPVRNRTMAALSDIVIIIEGEAQSGTLITARNALEFGIEVGAVPGSIFAAHSTGPHNLIAEGAHIIRGLDDIEHALGMHLRPRFSTEKSDASFDKNAPCDKKDIDSLFAKLVKSM